MILSERCHEWDTCQKTYTDNNDLIHTTIQFSIHQLRTMIHITKIWEVNGIFHIMKTFMETSLWVNTILILSLSNLKWTKATPVIPNSIGLRDIINNCIEINNMMNFQISLIKSMICHSLMNVNCIKKKLESLSRKMWKKSKHYLQTMSNLNS